MTRVGFTSLVAVATCVAGLGCSPPERNLEPTCAGRAPARLEDIYAAHLQGCAVSGCHGTGQGGLTFHDAHDLWLATVDAPSVAGAPMPLVTPDKPGQSYLLRKLLPTDPDRMPEGGPYLDEATIEQVEGWICAGAPEPPVDDADGGTGTDGGSASPTVDGISPTSGVVGTQVTILGSGFSSDAASDDVRFGGTSATVTVATETTLIASVPAGATSGPVSVTVGGVTATSADVFQVITPNPQPTLAAIDPTSALAGGGDLTVSFTGSDFVAASTAELDGDALATTFVDSSRLTAVVPASALVHAAQHTLTVVSPEPGGGSSSGVTFTVDNPAPTVASLSPSGVDAGAGEVVVTVAGSGFVADTRLSVNGVDTAFSPVNATTLTFTLAASALASPTTLAVAVSNPTPGGGASAAVDFVVGNPAPVVTSASPTSVVAGSGAASVSLSGGGFVAQSQALVDGASVASTFVDASHLTVSLSSALTAVGGTHELSVRNPAPGGGTSGAVPFVVENPAPSISSIAPATVSTSGAPFTLTISGDGFNAATHVTFDGAFVTSALVDAHTMTADLPGDLAQGAHAVVLTNPAPGGGSASASLQANPSPKPSITGLAPSVGIADATFDLTLTGANFACSPPQTSVVLFDATTLAPSSCAATQLVVSIPPTAAGSHSVQVKNGPEVSDATTYTLANPSPTPVLDALSPASAVAGDATFTLKATGSSFVSGSVVRWNGADRPTTFVSSTELDATIFSTDLATPASATITIFSPAPGGGTSNGVSFDVVAPNPRPSISSLSPASVVAGSGGATVGIGGTNFLASSTATFDGSARPTSFVSPTSLTMTLSASDTQSAGPHAVVVTNPAPGGGTSGTFTFTVIAPNPVPTIASFSPASAIAGTSGLTLTIAGTGFVSGATSVTFNSLAKSATVTSSTALTISLTAADLASAGTFSVTVTNAAPGGGTSAAATFEVDDPLPVATSLSPSSITVGSGAQSVGVNGSGFVRASVASVDGSPRTTHFVSSAQLSVDLLAGDDAATGTHAITIANPAPGGGSSQALTLTISPPPNPVPQVSALSPCGTVAGGGDFDMTITGSGFVSSSTVTFRGAPLSTVTFVSSTELDASVPASAIATAPTNDAAEVVVTNPSPGGGSSSPFVFGVATKVSTLSANVQPIFNTTCATSGCHDNGFGFPAGGMDLSAGHAFSNTVGVSSGDCPGEARIKACGPLRTQSCLIEKLIDGSMPERGSITQSQLQSIIDWAAQGAPQ